MPRVVITNWMLSGRSGTETFTRDLALSLHGTEWQPVVFTFAAGALAHELRDAGVQVVTDPRDLPADAEIVHGHHNFITIAALLACAQARGVFVCHDAVSWHDEAPVFPRIIRYAGVDDVCRERVARDLDLSVEEVCFMGNTVDMTRFPMREPLPEKPVRALLFSNYAAEHTFLPVVREACAQTGLQLDVIGGGVGRSVERPEEVLGKYDIVFAKARCAMESLASGCATILCGMEGAGPLVYEGNFHSLRRDNFGRRCLTLPMQVESLVTAIRAYDAASARRTGVMARESLDLKNAVGEWAALYENMMLEVVTPRPAHERLAAARLFGQLSPQLFRLFDLQSVNDFLQKEVRRLHDLPSDVAAENSGLLQKIAGLEERRDHYRAQRDRWKEKALSGAQIKGILGWLQRHAWTRPLAKALGVRPIEK
jgi:hypothetical protein